MLNLSLTVNRSVSKIKGTNIAQNIIIWSCIQKKIASYAFPYHAFGDYCMVISVLYDSIHGSVDVHISSNKRDT